MYRQYENPRLLEAKLKALIEERDYMEKTGCDIYDLVDICLEIADVKERINFAWQDDEYDCQSY